MSELPSGTVTFLFSDIEGSTKRWEAYPQQMRAALARHDTILRSSIEGNKGHVFKTIGDAFCAAFSSPHDALSAALQAQHALNEEEWPAEVGAVKVRAALHTGVVDEQGGDYFGQPVNRVARLLSAGHGGQVLLSLATQELVRDNLPPASQLADMGEHRLKDLIRPERIFQIVAAGLPSSFPPLNTLDNHPNNLPVQPTSLIGREKEMDALCGLLHRDDVRLVTLTGPGGSGKTRLALQVAAELLEQFADGVRFVELGALTEASLVASTIAQVLGVTEVGGSPLVDSLTAYLREKQLLLLLDNFEQVLDASDVITDIVRSAARVKVLVTSRVKLNLYGEHEYVVPPLSLPPDARKGHVPPPERLSQYEAVRLFIERAQAVKADFQITNDNAPAVAEICLRLDGLPLAIELAAARTKMLPPHALLARLSERLKLLTGGSRDLPARQQTLRNAIEWSYDLLSPGEQQLFTRMAVFQGGRTFEALEAMCNSDGKLQVDVLDGVQSLLDKSLLQEREGRNGEPRFWMLETIHEYAREKLRESGESEQLRRCHAHYFLAMAEEAEPHLRGLGQQEWLGKLDDEHDNLRAALQWAKESDEADDVQAGLRGMVALEWLWILRGYYTEGREHLRDLLAKADQAPVPNAETTLRRRPALLGHPSEESQLRALGVASNLARFQGDFPATHSLAEEALKRARELGDRASIAGALNNLGHVALYSWNLRAARPLFEESLAVRRELGDKAGVAGSLTNLAITAMEEADFRAARALFDESKAIWGELGNRALVTWQDFNLGVVAADQGDFAGARSLIEESMEVCRELGDRDTVCSALLLLGNVAVCEGDYARAEALYEESLAMSREMGLLDYTARDLLGLGNLAALRGDYPAASASYQQGAALQKKIGDEAISLSSSGIAANYGGDCSRAHTLLEEALALYVEGDYRKAIGETLGELGESIAGMGQTRRGVVLLGGADRLLRSMGVVLCRSRSMPYEQAHERTTAHARSLLGDVQFQKAWQEGQAMSMEQAIDYARGNAAPLPEPGHSKESRVEALNVASNLARWQGDLSAARSLGEQALSLAREAGDRASVANALNNLGNVAWCLSDLKTARGLYEESLAIRRELGDKPGVTVCLSNLGNVAGGEGDYRRARTLYEEAAARARERGDRAMVAFVLRNLAEMVLEQQDFDYARTLIDEYLAIAKELNDRDVIVSATYAMGLLAAEEGDYQRARALFEESLAMARELGVKDDIAVILQYMGYLASLQEDYATASTCYEEAAAVKGEMGAVADSFWLSGMVADQRGQYESARSLLERSLALSVQAHCRAAIYEIVAQLGVVFVDKGEARRGAVLLGGAYGVMSALGGAMSPACRISFERARNAVRSQLGDEEFQKAWQEGQVMSMEQVIQYATEEHAAAPCV